MWSTRAASSSVHSASRAGPGDVGGGPEADALTAVVGGGDDRVQLLPLGGGELAGAQPAEALRPVAGDQRDEGGGGGGAEVVEAAVVEGVPDTLRLHGDAGRAVAGDDGGDGAEADAAVGVACSASAGSAAAGGRVRDRRRRRPS